MGLPSRLKKPPGIRPDAHVLAVVNGERQEIDAFARAWRAAGGHEHDGVARSNEDRSVCLFRQLAGFEVMLRDPTWISRRVVLTLCMVVVKK